MPKKRTVSNEARAKVMLELLKYPDGCTVTALNQKLGWRKRETKIAVDDLLYSGMVYGDYLSPWVKGHLKGTSVAGLPYLLKVAPKGNEFLQHWGRLEELSSTRDFYSELEKDIEEEEERRPRAGPKTTENQGRT